MNKKVLVTGIGGVVGQGILRNLNQLGLDITVIGTNVKKISAGNYLCDRVYEVPYAYEPDFIPAMVKIVKRDAVDLIVPSTDYEAYYLGSSRNSLDCEIACSPPEVTGMCLDKYKTYHALKAANIPFAESRLPSLYNNEFSKIVVKPREGRGSRDICVNPSAPKSFDDTYVIQDYLDGPELTTAFYVTKEKRLHGQITFVRELDSGNTSKCEVVFDYDKEVNYLIEGLISNFRFSGSSNIQARVTSNGIVPFEINCRISGTNSVRSQFGFSDVEYTVQELLFNQNPNRCEIRKGSALRVMLDLIYPDKTLHQISDKNDNFYIN